MTLAIRHVTRYAYDPEATHVALRLKLFPQTFGAQKPVSWRVSVNDDPVTQLLTDPGGDGVGLWLNHGALEEVEIVAEGVIETTNTAGVLTDLKAPMRAPMYLRPTPLTKPSDAIRSLAAEAETGDTLARLHTLSALIHKAIDYRQGATTASTTAAEAAALGAGVCQDQAHVFIAAARMLDIPARYVAGYLYDPDADEPGDETHAWAEAHVDGLGWVGFDITNQLCPTEVYVRLASGLDAADAAPVRGVFGGDIEEHMTAEVAVTQASQSQQ